MLPLAHRRILVTRARGQASALAELLGSEGATPILIPTIEIATPESWEALDAGLRGMAGFDWLILTSANAVTALTDRARALGVLPRPRRIAAIGPATAKAVVASGLAPQVDLMPDEFIAESFAEALWPHARGKSMLLVRAAEARDLLPQQMVAAGARVTVAEAYRNRIPTGSIEALSRLFAADPPDGITFTSGSTARNLAGLLEAGGLAVPPDIVLASIGPITSEAMRALGLEPTVEADEATIPALVGALIDYFG
jgi:uroporphyrinogen-III synthase